MPIENRPEKATAMQARDTSLTTDQKALAINLDKYKYGAIVEIGAGQEVARRFFHVGGAAGTIAKTMSAYDMAISDEIYGHVDRYVSRARLLQMLDNEFRLVVDRHDDRHLRSPAVGHRARAHGLCGRLPQDHRHRPARVDRLGSPGVGAGLPRLLRVDEGLHRL